MFIVCVETSGTNGGFNEQCAKSFCLALMRIDLAENRRCYIMLFSTENVRYELSGPQGIEQAIRFIAQRFPDDVTSKVKELQRVHQHRFLAVAMSAHGKPGIMRIFVHIWRFETRMRSRLLRRWRR